MLQEFFMGTMGAPRNPKQPKGVPSTTTDGNPTSDVSFSSAENANGYLETRLVMGERVKSNVAAINKICIRFQPLLRVEAMPAGKWESLQSTSIPLSSCSAN